MLAIDPMVSSTPASISSDDQHSNTGGIFVAVLIILVLLECLNFELEKWDRGACSEGNSSWAHNFGNETSSWSPIKKIIHRTGQTLWLLKEMPSIISRSTFVT
jgi:hypothetical protein